MTNALSPQRRDAILLDIAADKAVMRFIIAL